MPVTNPADTDPLRPRWMLFVDGENLVFRAQELANKRSIDLTPGSYYLPDVFVWIPNYLALEAFTRLDMPLQRQALRGHYYTSVVGDEPKIYSVRDALWNIGFQPRVFKKKKQDAKAKAVDIALTTDLLSNAYNNNYDAAMLIAGDGDYVPLVEEIKRLGKLVYLAFFETEGLNDDLRLASDWFLPGFEEFFLGAWEKYQEP